MAIRYLDGAIHQGATNSADFEQLAILLAAANRQSDALKILQQGMQLIPYYAEFYRLSASVNFSANRKQEACKVVAKGVDKFPQDTAIRDLSKMRARTARKFRLTTNWADLSGSWGFGRFHVPG